ncbi:unnamed protein product [Closterium sp. NIES-53]
MASLRVLAFDHEGRPVQFDTWLDDLQLYLLSDIKDGVSLFDHVSGAATAPPTTADVARYSSPATAALGRLLLPYLFPDLSAFTTVKDLVSHICASDARYRAAVPAEFLDRNQPPMFITLYFIVTRLPDSLRSVRDHFLSLDLTSLTVDLLEQHLLAAETSAVAVGAARGTPRPPFLEGCSPSPLAPSYASAAAADVSIAEDVGAASASAKRRSSKGKGGGGGGGDGGGGGSGSSGGGSSGGGSSGGSGGGSGGSGGGCGGSGGTGCGGSSGTGGGGTGARRSGSGGGQRQQQQRRSETPSPQQLREIAIFDLDFDAILSAMYALSVSAEGDCYRCVLPDPSIAATALGASASGTLPGTAPAEDLKTFTLDSGALRCFFRDSTTLTPLPAPLPVTLADPSGGLVVARSSTVLPCPAVPSGSLSGLHLPSFSTNLVSTDALQDAMVTTTTPGGQRVSICTCTRTGRHLAMFTRWPGSSLYTLATEPSQTLLWHHRLGHTSLPRLRGMHSRLLVCGLPRSLPPLPPSPVPPCLPCVEGRQRAAPHSSSFPPTSAPLQTLHMDIGGEFSFTLLREFCCGEGILQSFTLPDSPQQNGIAERLIGLVMEVARTSMIHAAAPHFLSPFAVRYAQPLAPCLLAGDLAHTALDGEGWRCVGVPGLGFSCLCSFTTPPQDVTFDESVPFYRAVSGGAEPGGTESKGAETGGAEPGGVETGGAEPRGAEPEDVEPRGAESEGAESGGAEPQGAASSGGSTGASPSLSPQQLREWFVRRAHLRSGATGAGGAGAAGAGGAGVAAGAGVPGGTAATGPGGACTRGTGAAGTGGVEGAGARDATEFGAGGIGCPGAGGAGPGGAKVGGIGAGGAGVGGRGVGGGGAGGAGAIAPGGTVRPRPYFVPLLQKSSGLTERREPASRLVSPVHPARRVPRLHPPRVPGTHAMTLHPSFESAAASALVAELLDFAVACRLDYTTALVAEFASASPPSVRGECALATDLLQDRQEDFDCLAAPVPRFASMLLATEEDPDAPNIPTPRSYTEAITGPYSSQWQAAMDAEMASWKSTGTYVDKDPPPGANIVDGMWIFRRDYESHSLDFSTAFLQGSLHEEIWLRRPPGFTESFPAGTQWSLQRPVYGLCQWHDTLRTTLAALGFTPATADPSLFLRTDTLLPPFYVLVYVDDLVFASADTEALTLVKSELQKRHTCTDLGELRSYLGLQITRDKARRTITLTQSHMVHQVLQRLGFQFSSPQPTPLSTNHSLSAAPSDESVEPSGLYQELVGCLMYLMTCILPDLAYPLSLLARYVVPGRHRKVHWYAAERVLRYLCSRSGMGLVLGGRGPVVLIGHADASWVDDSATQRSSHGYTFSLGSGSVSWRSTHSSSVLSSSCEAEIYAGAMAAQELRWLTYLLTDLGEQPRSLPVLYVDNKAMIALCQEHRLEHRTKHIALRYFLARELQQRGQLRLAYVATWANTADVFTKERPPGDHQRFSTVLGLVPTLPHLLTA